MNSIFLSLLLAAASAQAPAHPKLAVVIDDFGLTYKRDQPDADWMALKFPITFAVMPVSPTAAGKGSTKSARDAAAAGHEVIIHFPFDKYLDLTLPKDEIDPEDLKKVEALFATALKQVPGPKGLNNHQSYRGTMNRPMMVEFMKLLKPTGLFFIDSHVSTKSVAYAEAKKAGIPTAVNSIFLDGGREPKGRRSGDAKLLAEAIAADKKTCEGYLRVAAGLAKKNGRAVAIGHHYFRGTYQCLVEEVPKLQAQGFDFVFASAVVQ